MKNEFGLCTRRLSLCLRASEAGEGCRRSTANCTPKQKSNKRRGFKNRAQKVWQGTAKGYAQTQAAAGCYCSKHLHDMPPAYGVQTTGPQESSPTGIAVQDEKGRLDSTRGENRQAKQL